MNSGEFRCRTAVASIILDILGSLRCLRGAGRYGPGHATGELLELQLKPGEMPWSP